MQLSLCSPLCAGHLTFDSEGAKGLNREENERLSGVSVKTQTQFSSLNCVCVLCLWRVKEMLTGLKFGF